MDNSINNIGKGNISIDRKSKFYGSALGMEVYLDDRYVAQVKNGKNVQFSVSTGEHMVYVILSNLGYRSNPIAVNISLETTTHLQCGVSGLASVFLKKL